MNYKILLISFKWIFSRNEKYEIQSLFHIVGIFFQTLNMWHFKLKEVQMAVAYI